MAKRMKKGRSFDLDDLRGQLLQMKKMGGMGALMGMMPGMGQIKKQMAGSNLDDKVVSTRQIAIINSMTKAERANPERAQRQAPHPYRQWLGHQGRRRQQADEAAPPDGGHDEEGQQGRHGLAGRHVWRQARQHDAGDRPDAGPGQHGPQAAPRGDSTADGDRPRLARRRPPKDISQKLPSDVGQLLKSGSGLPGLGGASRFPGLPGLGGGFVPKKK